MTHSPADVVRRLLIDAGLGTLPSAAGAWPVNTKEPDTPDDAITVFNTAGKQDGRTMTDGDPNDQYGVQVRVRSATDSAGRAKANAVRDYMAATAYDGVVAVGDSRYLVHSFAGIGQVLYLGDAPDSRRQLFTVNATVTMTQTA